MIMNQIKMKQPEGELNATQKLFYGRKQNI